MSTSVASDLETASPPRGGGLEKIALFAAKLLVTGACFWYISRQIDLSQVLSAIPLLDFRWAAFAVLLAACCKSRSWRCAGDNILDALAALDERMTRAAVIAVTAIGVFFSQVLPSVAGEGCAPGSSFGSAAIGATR